MDINEQKQELLQRIRKVSRALSRLKTEDIKNSFESKLDKLKEGISYVDSVTELEFYSTELTQTENEIEDEIQTQNNKKVIKFEGAEMIKGEKGDKGDPGKTIVGPQGPKGDKGDSVVGPMGPKPVAGKDYRIPQDGRDGKDGIGFMGPQGPNGNDGKDGSPDTGEEIVVKINSLDTVLDKQIDFVHIKNFPWHQVKSQSNGDVYSGFGMTDLTLKASTLGQITSNQNDYATGLGSWFRISSDAARDITGFENGTDGRSFLLTNVGSFAITLKNQSASSQATNRILNETGADIALAANDTAWIIYDITTGRWRAIIHSVGGGGSGSGDFVGPSSSTDNAIVRFDGTTGKLGQNSAVTIDDTTGNLSITSPAGANRSFFIKTSGSARWEWGGNLTAESGANAGSDFFVNRYNDSGVYINTPFGINRATGTSTFYNPLVLSQSGSGSNPFTFTRSDDGFTRVYIDGFGGIHFGGTSSVSSQFLLDKDASSTTLMNLKNINGPASILILDSDTTFSGGPNAEATFTGRVLNATGTDPEFIDWFHNHYSDNGDIQYGILMQRQGSALYRPFIIGYSNLSASNPAEQVRDRSSFVNTTPTLASGTAGGVSITGTVAISATTAVVGTGTLFTTELEVGQSILIGSVSRTITVITDNTHLTVAAAWTATASGQTAKKYNQFLGQWGFRVFHPTAFVDIGGGTGGATVGSASLKIRTATALLTTPEDGAIENDGTHLYYTASGVRYQLDQQLGTGDVTGPSSSTDNAVVRFDSTTGKIIQNSGVLIDDSNNMTPAANDAAALGTTALMWSDLFLASGSVINWNNGDLLLTHSSNQIVLTGGNFSVSGNTVSAAAFSAQASANLLTLTNTTDNASVQIGILQGDRATITANDEAYLSLKLSDSVGTQTEFARITWAAPTVTDASETGRLDFSVMTSGTLAKELQLSGADLSPSSNDGLSLGTTSLQFSDLFLAEGAVINWDNSDATITQTNNDITIAGITTFGVGTSTAVTLGTIELGAASDTTIARVSAGVVSIEGVNILTVAGGLLTGAITLGENTSIALDPAGSADGKYSGITVTGVAGTTLVFGDLVYLAAVDSRWELTDADAAATAGDVMLGICVLAAAADGSPTTILLHGIIRADARFPALTISAQVYISTTPGDIVVVQPSGTDDVIRVVGRALTADEIYFDPAEDYITHT